MGFGVHTEPEEDDEWLLDENIKEEALKLSIARAHLEPLLHHLDVALLSDPSPTAACEPR